MAKEAKVKDAKKCYPYNVSDVNLRDTDSGMRLYRGMSSPWGAIKNFYETYKFTHRLGAEFSVAAFHALRIVFPDYNRLQTLLSDNWGAFMDGCWDPASGQIEPFEDRFDVPPFLKDGQIRAAIYADKGDTMNLISGKIWYTTNDRFEKEIHVCDYDIAGPEACDLSLGGGAHFCYGLAGCPLNAMDPERIGMGDDYCLAIQETKRKYGKHVNSNAEDQFDEGQREWEVWGPAVAQSRPKPWPRKPYPEFVDKGYFESPTGARWTAGELYQDVITGYPIAYAYNAIDLYRNEMTNEECTLWDLVCPALFEACGKFQFADWQTRKATREWMDVPADVDDARVMGAWISMCFQARDMEYSFTEFDAKKTVIEGDMTKWDMMGMYPELNQMYQYIFDGNVKTLVGAKWSVDMEEDYDNNKIRYIISQRPIGWRRQKPNLGVNNYEGTKEGK